MFYQTIFDEKHKMNLPIVTSSNPLEYQDLDNDLLKIIQASIEDNAYNNQACFWIDSLCQSFAYIIIYTIIGDKIFVDVKDNDEAGEKIRKWNNKTNILGDTVEDIIIDAFIDNINHAQSMWRIAKKIPQFEEQLVDVQRIPMESLEEIRDPIYGWRKWKQIQDAQTSYKTYKDFLKENVMKLRDVPNEVIIPDHPGVIMRFSFFRRPPMASVSHFIVYKRWIYWFLRKYAEKMWAPTRMAFVGDPRTNFYPSNPFQMKAELTTVNNILVKLRNFSTATFPGHTRVETSDPGSHGDIYLKYIDKLNEEIMFGLYGSMGVRSATQTFKANNTADQSVVNVMRGIRREIEIGLSNFYVTNIVPEADKDDIVFTWPTLRTVNAVEISKAIEVLSTFGVFKDARERRKIASLIFSELAIEKITDEEAKRLDAEKILLTAPSQPGMTTPDAANKSKPKTTNKST